jgi:hypothetical protein
MVEPFAYSKSAITRSSWEVTDIGGDESDKNRVVASRRIAAGLPPPITCLRAFREYASASHTITVRFDDALADCVMSAMCPQFYTKVAKFHLVVRSSDELEISVG